jgi:dihydrofolate reductase
MPRISIISAVAKDRAIGKNNQLLWNIPADLKRFKELTSGHPIIMGLNTFNSLPGVLPNRTNIVLSPDPMEIPGAVVVNSLEEALKVAEETGTDEVFIIGGGYVYSQTIGLADRLYLTIVDGDYEADVYFPDYSKFTKVISEEKSESNGYTFKYVTLER